VIQVALLTVYLSTVDLLYSLQQASALVLKKPTTAGKQL